MTGHFEKGAWIETSFDKLNAVVEEFSAEMVSLTMAMIKFSDTEIYGYFKEGRWISIKMKDLPSLVINAMQIPPVLLV